MKKYEKQYLEWKANPPLCTCACGGRVNTENTSYSAFQSVYSRSGRGPIFILGHQIKTAEQHRLEKIERAACVFDPGPIPNCCRPQKGPGERHISCTWYSSAGLGQALANNWHDFHCGDCVPVYRGVQVSMESGIDTCATHHW